MKAPEALLRPTAHLSAPRARGRNLTAGPSIINGIGDLLTNIGEFEIFIFGQRLLGRESEFAIFDCFFSQIIRVVHGTPPISERSYRKFSRGPRDCQAVEMYSRIAVDSSSISCNRCLTTSPIDTIPTRRPWSTTGT